MIPLDRLRRAGLERLAARLEKVADAASRDFTSLFFSRQKGRPTVPRAKGGAQVRGGVGQHQGAGKGTS